MEEEGGGSLKYLIMSALDSCMTRGVATHLHRSSRFAPFNLSLSFSTKCILHFLITEHVPRKAHKPTREEQRICSLCLAHASSLSYAVLKHTKPQCGFEEAMSCAIHAICIDKLMLSLSSSQCFVLAVVDTRTFYSGIAFGISILKIFCCFLSSQPAECSQISFVSRKNTAGLRFGIVSYQRSFFLPGDPPCRISFCDRRRYLCK